MKKRQTGFVLLVTGVLLSMFLAISDLLVNAGISACRSACTAVHNSSFGKIWGIPIGFFAAVIFACLIVSHWRGKKKATVLGVCLMAGTETYLTLIQFTHLEGICYWCLGFYALVLVCLAALISVHDIKVAVIMVLLAFFTTHFVFFPPGADLKTSLVQTDGGPQIEIFASPSCEHCEEAIENLKVICSSSSADLVLRPVGLTDTDRATSTDWVCYTIFDRHNAASRRLAEKIVWKNEKEARGLNDGRLAVPIIVVKSDTGKSHTYHGWTPEVKLSIEKIIGSVHGLFPMIRTDATNFEIGFSSADASSSRLCGSKSSSVCTE